MLNSHPRERPHPWADLLIGRRRSVPERPSSRVFQGICCLPSEDHLFEIFDAKDNLVVDSLTDEEGFSSYFQLDIIRKLAGNDIALFNPFKIIYENNNVPVIVYKNISYNHTIDLLLDTQPPTTILVSGEPLINQQTINLEIMLCLK